MRALKIQEQALDRAEVAKLRAEEARRESQKPNCATSETTVLGKKDARRKKRAEKKEALSRLKSNIAQPNTKIPPQSKKLPACQNIEEKNTEVANITYNHSTFVVGLKPFMEKLKLRPGIKKITPGRLNHVHSIAPIFEFRVQREKEYSWKLVVKNGSTVQDLFIETDDWVTTKEAIEDILHAVQKKERASTTCLDQSDLACQNKSIQKQKSLAWKQLHLAKHMEQGERVRLEHENALAKIQLRKLKSSQAVKEGMALKATADRDFRIVHKKGTRGKKSMK
jgi:hypothetical protein